MLDSLDDVRGDIASRLSRAAKDRKLPMHAPVVGTSDADMRVMVLRAFDPENWTLRFHTDARSPKCDVIGECAPVGVLAYDPPEKLQFRLRGNGRILRDGPEVDAAWGESTNFARRCYLGEGPGTQSETPTSGLPEWAEGIQPTDVQIAPGRANFAILLVKLARLDWFYLANSGHVRAQFVRAGKGWDGQWVSP